MWTQTKIYEYLVNNPLKVDVHIGDLEDMNGKDYIFLDYLNDYLIGSDDKGCYKTSIQFTVATRDFDKRKILTKYIQDQFNVQTTYEKDMEFEYYLSRNTTELVLWQNEEE